jgi:hypothetical protein
VISTIVTVGIIANEPVAAYSPRPVGSFHGRPIEKPLLHDDTRLPPDVRARPKYPIKPVESPLAGGLTLFANVLSQRIIGLFSKNVISMNPGIRYHWMKVN